MRADTGVGPSIASSSQACSGTWADLPQAPSRRSTPIQLSVVSVALAGAAADHAEARGAEGDEHQEDREAHPHVADAVDDERLLGRGCRRVLVLPEPDEEVRREAHALPA